MEEDRFIQKGASVYDIEAETLCAPTATLMAYANAWARFIGAYRDDDEAVGNVIARAGLED